MRFSGQPHDSFCSRDVHCSYLLGSFKNLFTNVWLRIRILREVALSSNHWIAHNLNLLKLLKLINLIWAYRIS